MNFIGALGGIGQGVSAGIQDVRNNELAKQQKQMNDLRMQQIQMGIAKAQKEQQIEDAYNKERAGFVPAKDKYAAEYDREKAEVTRKNAEIQKRIDHPMPEMVAANKIPAPGAAPQAEPLAPEDPRFMMKPETEQRPDINIPPNPEFAPPKLLPMPTKRAVGLHDELSDLIARTQIDAKYGKAKHEDVYKLVSSLKEMEAGGINKALNIALTGDYKGAMEAYRQSGGDPTGMTFTQSSYDMGDGTPPIKSVKITLPNGQTLDAVGTLVAQARGVDFLKNHYEERKLATEGKKVEGEISNNAGKLAEDIRHNTGTMGETRRNHLADEEIKRAENAAKLAETNKKEQPYTSQIDQMGGTIIRLDKSTGELININARTGKEVSRLPAGSIAPPPVVAPPQPEQSTTEKLRKWASGLLPSDKKETDNPGSSDKVIKSAPAGNDKAAASKQVPPPKAGDVSGNYKFKGGDPRSKENWVPVSKPQEKPVTDVAKPAPVKTEAKPSLDYPVTKPTPAKTAPAPSTKAPDAVQQKPVNTAAPQKSKVIPWMKRKPNGDFYISEIPKDGQYYQNMIYRDGTRRFMVDAKGVRKYDNEFDKAAPSTVPAKPVAKATPQPQAATGISDQTKAKAMKAEIKAQKPVAAAPKTQKGSSENAKIKDIEARYNALHNQNVTDDEFMYGLGELVKNDTFKKLHPEAVKSYQEYVDSLPTKK